MTTLYFDTETFSEVDLKRVDPYTYAEDPSTRVIVAQWALDDGEVIVEDLTGGARPSEVLLEQLRSADEVVIHNAAFDRAVVRACWGVELELERIRCTMAQAQEHGLPGSLDALSEIFGLGDAAKDKRGKRLIQLFCKPQPKSHKVRVLTRANRPQEWAEFLEYARQDIVALRALSRKMPNWNFRPGSFERRLWVLDQQMNERGFRVDVDLARAAVVATEARKQAARLEVQEMTAGLLTSVSRGEEMLRFILGAYGLNVPDLQADTLRRMLEDENLPQPVRELLSLRAEVSRASAAKYRAVLASVSRDGYLRGTSAFCGAARTRRWAGRRFQPQNLPRPSKGFKAKQQEIAIAALKAGVADLLYDDVMRLAADCVRGLLIPSERHKLVVADLANIEGRVLAWLAGEEWKLEAFRAFDRGQGADLYKVAYARSFGVPVELVDDDQQRQIGKVQELFLGYEGGVAAYLTGAAIYGFKISDLTRAVREATADTTWGEVAEKYEWFKQKQLHAGLDQDEWTACRVLVESWRAAHPETVAFWAALRGAFAAAVREPGRVFQAGLLIRMRCDGQWLRVALPSGGFLCYVQPRVDEDGACSYMGVDQYTRQWKRIKTHGGKLAENVTQAVARDVLAYALPRIAAAGYRPLITVHDEVVTEVPDNGAGSAGGLCALLSEVPEWASGLPLAAAGFEAYRYRKG